MLALYFLVQCGVVAEAAKPGQSGAEPRIALVVGNGKYRRDPLLNPPRDANLIARTLVSVGFHVIRIIDGDRTAIQHALVEFGRRLAAPGSVGLFYYAGHGVQVNGDNYLLPVDVDIRTEREVLLQGINLNEILLTLRPEKNRLAVAVLDACRNNPFVGLARGLSRGLAPVTAPAGTLIAFSTAPGEVALDGDGDNSPYTAALAAAIPTPGLTIEEVFKRTRQRVMRATGNAQVPWEHSSLVGRFLFRVAPVAMPDDGQHAGVIGTDERLAEIAAWDRIKGSDKIGDFEKFLKKFPGGAFAELAHYRINGHADRYKSWTWWMPSVIVGADRDEAPGDDAEELFERALRFEAEQQGETDLEYARALFQAAAEKGLVPAMYRLGLLLERDARTRREKGGTKIAFENRLKAAANWYAKAVEKGYAPAQRALGALHEFGDGVPKDLAEALRLYKLAGEGGDAAGMTSLAFLYASGKGVFRDPIEARRWYVRAAKAGSERAMFNLAIMLMSPDGGPVEMEEAGRWLKEAAKKGHAGAMRQLAALFDEGRGLGRDTDAAALYLLKAFAAGDSNAEHDLFKHHRRWSRSTRRAVQRQLKSDGLYSGAVHGVFNASTRRALIAYRRRQ